MDPIARLNAALEGRYRIEREIGEGGMATVYLAEDLRHDRRVALKVLKPELAALVGADRFLSEIKTTANLHHPHILPLHDSGEAGGFLFFVMPYLEGETLRSRLDREQQLPVDEALGIATSVASALQHAHERGVIHRDIKPGNILLQDGQPVVADFGIALAVGSAGGNRLTETGLSVGTPYYMSPEQATGDQAIGPASDTYALGCVLFEMLTGEPPYPGKTAQAVLGKIIQGIPVSATTARKSVPPNVDAAIRKALEKLPADRFTGAHDFAKALADPAFRWGEGADGAGAAGGRGRRTPWWVAAAGWGVAVVALVALVLGRIGGRDAPDEIIRFALQLPDSAQIEPGGNAHDLAISRDGRMIAYQSLGGVAPVGFHFMLRSLDRMDAVRVRGTEGGAGPFFSLDGEWIGFVQAAGNSPLRKVSIFGGPPVDLATSSGGGFFGASWGTDDRIVVGQLGGPLGRVPAGGGPVEALAVPDTALGEVGYLWPSHIEGRNAVLFVVFGAAGSPLATGRLAALDLETLEVTRFDLNGSYPHYLATGHLVYAAPDGSLRAVPFDASRLEITGNPVPILDDPGAKGSGSADFAISANGRLAYAAIGGTAGTDVSLVWVDRSGREEPLAAPPRPYGYPRIAPDGNRALVEVRDGDANDAWIWDFRAETLTRVTLDESATYPVWSQDGARVVAVRPPASIVSKASNNTGDVEVLVESARSEGAATPSTYFVSPDGRFLVYRDQQVPDTDDDLVLMSLESGEIVDRLAGPYRERNAAISPDGRWMAYQSDESGVFEVYVRPFPDWHADQLQVSNAGAIWPVWARSGNELYYLRPTSPSATAVSVTLEGMDGRGSLAVAGREDLTQLRVRTGLEGRDYDVAADGRFLTVSEVAGASVNDAAGRINVVLNWFEEVRERMGGS